VSPKNLPFPVIVPDFPLLTTDKTLDYGRKWIRLFPIDIDLIFD
jgi:hypothetical protein